MEAGPTVLVVFGATGDLMTRKIVPALALLHMRGRLPVRFAVLGVSRRGWSDEDLRDHVCAILDSYPGATPTGEARATFRELFTYQACEFTDDSAYEAVARRLEAKDAEWGACSSKLHYLAVPPSAYGDIFDRLARSGLADACDDTDGWTRVLVEKPFGDDAATARALDAQLGSLFREEQIYRIDHYLAKEMLQGILNFRFSNNLFEASWDGGAIGSIDIRLLESLGAEKRGAFYDGVGALRDVGQNHLLQMLALVTMEQPVSLGPAAVRARRAELLADLRRMTPDDVARDTFRAQYDGYREIGGVSPDSRTETYFRLRAGVTGGRWHGVPVTLESGKRMGAARKEIVVTFRHPEPCYCSGGAHHTNRVVLTLEPEESIKIVFWAKKPGFEAELEEREFTFFLYEKEEKEQYVEEYAKLLLDAVLGDQTLFVSTAEVEAMWAFIDPVVQAWSDGAVPLEVYRPDSREVCERAQSAMRVGGAARDLGREVGLVGLGKMGAGLARNWLDAGWRVVGCNRSRGPVDELEADGGQGASSLADMVSMLSPPRIVWLMVPAGAPVEDVLFGDGALIGLLEPGDTVIDGGNSLFSEAPERARRLAARGIRFMDVGTSGGPRGARYGACLMVGGERSDFERLEPLFDAVAAPGAYRHFEGHGAGHFVKMVHNGIEYGMMQSIAEGFALMRESGQAPDLRKAAEVYGRASVIESRLVGWLVEAFEAYGVDLDGVSGTVGHTGEGEWTVRTAEGLGVPVPAISAALEFRKDSEARPSYAGRILSALRARFGGHDA